MDPFREQVLEFIGSIYRTKILCKRNALSFSRELIHIIGAGTRLEFGKLELDWYMSGLPHPDFQPAFQDSGFLEADYRETVLKFIHNIYRTKSLLKSDAIAFCCQLVNMIGANACITLTDADLTLAKGVVLFEKKKRFVPPSEARKIPQQRKKLNEEQIENRRLTSYNRQVENLRLMIDDRQGQYLRHDMPPPVPDDERRPDDTERRSLAGLNGSYTSAVIPHPPSSKFVADFQNYDFQNFSDSLPTNTRANDGNAKEFAKFISEYVKMESQTPIDFDRYRTDHPWKNALCAALFYIDSKASDINWVRGQAMPEYTYHHYSETIPNFNLPAQTLPEGFTAHHLKEYSLDHMVFPQSTLEEEGWKDETSKKHYLTYPVILELQTYSTLHESIYYPGRQWLTTFVVHHPMSHTFVCCDHRHHTLFPCDEEWGDYRWFQIGKDVVQSCSPSGRNQIIADTLGTIFFPLTDTPYPTLGGGGRYSFTIRKAWAIIPPSMASEPQTKRRKVSTSEQQTKRRKVSTQPKI